MARARPRPSGGADPIQRLLILLDTSASRAAGFTHTVALTGALIHEVRVLGSEVPLQVACFDQSVEPVFTGMVGQFSTKELERIMSRW